MMNEKPLTLSVEEAGRLLSCSRGHSYRLAKAGLLPVLRLGRKLRVPRVALERMLAEAGKEVDSP